MEQEFFHGKEYNLIKENKPFKAEEYRKSKEYLKGTKESLSVPEENNLKRKKIINSGKDNSFDKDMLKKLSGNTAVTTGGVAAATATVAVVATASVFSGFVAPPPEINLLELTSCSDGVYFSVDGDKLDENTNYNAIIYGVATGEEYSLDFKKGNNQFIQGNLKPDSQYLFKIVGEKGEEGKIEYFQKKFTTAKKDKLSALIRFEEVIEPLNKENNLLNDAVFGNENNKNNSNNSENQENPSENESIKDGKSKFFNYEIYVSDLLDKGEEYYYEIISPYGGVVKRDKLNKGTNRSQQPIKITNNVKFIVYMVVDGEPVVIGERAHNCFEDVYIPEIAPPVIELESNECTADGIYYTLNSENLDKNMEYTIKLSSENDSINYERPLLKGINKDLITGLNPSTDYNLTVEGYSELTGKIVYFNSKITTKPIDYVGAIIIFEGETAMERPVAMGNGHGRDFNRRFLKYSIYYSDLSNSISRKYYEIKQHNRVLMADELVCGINKCEPVPINYDLEFVVYKDSGQPEIIATKIYDSGIELPDIKAPEIKFNTIDVASDGLHYSLKLTKTDERMNYFINIEGLEDNFYYNRQIDGDFKEEIITGLTPLNNYTIKIMGYNDITLEREYFNKQITTLNAVEVKALMILSEIYSESQPDIGGQDSSNIGDTSQSVQSPRKLDYQIYISDYNSIAYSDEINGIYPYFLTNREGYIKIPLTKGMNIAETHDIEVAGDVNVIVKMSVSDTEWKIIGNKTYIDNESPHGKVIIDKNYQYNGINSIKIPYKIEMEAGKEYKMWYFNVTGSIGGEIISANAIEESEFTGYFELSLPDTIDVSKEDLILYGEFIIQFGQRENENHFDLGENIYRINKDILISENNAVLNENGETDVNIKFSAILQNGEKIIVEKAGEKFECVDGLFKESSITGEIKYIYYIADSAGNAISEIKTVVLNKIDATKTPNYTINNITKPDIVKTYNNDGTFNLYLDTGFTCEDKNVVCAFEYESDDGIVKGIAKDGFITIENIYFADNLKISVLKNEGNSKHIYKIIDLGNILDSTVKSYIQKTENVESGGTKVVFTITKNQLKYKEDAFKVEFDNGSSPVETIVVTNENIVENKDNYVITVDKTSDGKYITLKCQVAEYYVKYQELSEKIPIKGNMFRSEEIYF